MIAVAGADPADAIVARQRDRLLDGAGYDEAAEPLSPSITAAARACRITVISGRVLSPPALMRRMYCGKRKTPCPSAPLISEAAINSAAFAASASGMPTARYAAAMKRISSACATRAAFGFTSFGMIGCLT